MDTRRDIINQQARTIARQQQRIAELEAREAVLKDIIEKALRIREYTHRFFTEKVQIVHGHSNHATE